MRNGIYGYIGRIGLIDFGTSAMMTVKPLSYFLDYLKHTLRDNTCSICHTSSVDRDRYAICEGCERRVMMRPSRPLVDVGQGEVYAATAFANRMKQLLYGLKFHQKTSFAGSISDVLIHYWDKMDGLYEGNWLVVPIPTHSDQSFHHVSYFGRSFASQFGYDFAEYGLYWTREVKRQHTLLSKRRRKENVYGAMAVSDQLVEHLLKRQCKVLILDDLVTTGTTMAEATAAFHRLVPDIEVYGLTVSYVPFAMAKQVWPTHNRSISVDQPHLSARH